MLLWWSQLARILSILLALILSIAVLTYILWCSVVTSRAERSLKLMTLFPKRNGGIETKPASTPLGNQILETESD